MDLTPVAARYPAAASSLGGFRIVPALGTLPKDVLFHIFLYLRDEDLFSLSLTNKRLCMYALSDSVVYERRFKRMFPFDMDRLWDLVLSKYNKTLRAAFAVKSLSFNEQNAVVKKFINDTVDRFPDKWFVDALEQFRSGGVIGATLRDQAVFYLFNVLRNPVLRSAKATDKFFADQALVAETMSLFEMSNCTLFEALHLVFGHALSLPGEAQKIDRALEVFANTYHSRLTPEQQQVNSANSLFVLSFALIMLNSDLHNQAVKNHMTLAQFIKNISGAVVLSEAEARTLYLQVLCCEMIQMSSFVTKVTKKLYTVKYLGPTLGYKRLKRVNVTLCQGELLIEDGATTIKFILKNCLIARSVGPAGFGTLRQSGKVENLGLLHVVTLEEPINADELLKTRLNGHGIILSSENTDDLKDLEKAIASHRMPNLQRLLNGTWRKISRKQ